MIWTAFIVGLLGSLHCVGMCGPIALALPYGNPQNRFLQLSKIGFYNAGRILTYILLGILIGLLGKGLFLAGVQKWLSIVLGLSLIAIGMFSLPVESRIMRSPIFSTFFTYVKGQLGKHLRLTGLWSFLRTGMINGLLPCGLVYVAMVGAFSMATITESSLYMLFFGLGTFPLMAATAIFGQVISIPWRNRLRKVYPFVISLVGLLLVFRGLHFVLPPGFDLWEKMQYLPMCH